MISAYDTKYTLTERASERARYGYVDIANPFLDLRDKAKGQLVRVQGRTLPRTGCYGAL